MTLGMALIIPHPDSDFSGSIDLSDLHRTPGWGPSSLGANGFVCGHLCLTSTDLSDGGHHRIPSMSNKFWR